MGRSGIKEVTSIVNTPPVSGKAISGYRQVLRVESTKKKWWSGKLIICLDFVRIQKIKE